MQSTHPAPWELSHPPQHSSHQDEDDEDVKAPYDDLIDQYATPYRQGATHKAYAVDPSAFDQSKGAAPTYALSQKTTHTSETHGKDLEGSTTHLNDWAYPPSAGKEEKGKGKGSWSISSVRLV